MKTNIKTTHIFLSPEATVYLFYANFGEFPKTHTQTHFNTHIIIDLYTVIINNELVIDCISLWRDLNGFKV